MANAVASIPQPMPNQNVSPPSVLNPYPCLLIPSIIMRCSSDLHQFEEVYKFDVSEYVLPGVVSGIFMAAKTLAELQSRMESIMDRIVSTSGTSMADFDYPHQIREYNEVTQKKLWCLRTLLFYQLLITVTEMMNNEQLFNEVYQYSENNGITRKRAFRGDIVAELKNYKLGIFGSITPSSDIDLGVQYSGFNTDVIELAYIVSVFEDSFLIFTGKSSLKFDIETYADLVTVPDIRDKSNSNAASLTCSNVRDVFPYDTSKLTYLDFLKLLPFVFAGILRNYIIAQKDIRNSATVAEIVESFNIDDFLTVATNKTGTDFLEIVSRYRYIPDPDDVNKYIPVPGDMKKELLVAFYQAKKIAIGYMEAPYADTREEYYRFVQTAEESTVQLKKGYFKTGEVNILNDKLIEILMNASKALVYREESYTCFPTVMHVVRVMQANSKNPGKYKTLEPSYCLTNKLGDAYCAIDNYGYLISLFEQLGYIYRFDITYCKPPNIDKPKIDKTKSKCDAKFNKYADRFKNGLDLLTPPPPIQQQSSTSPLQQQSSTSPPQQQSSTSPPQSLFSRVITMISGPKQAPPQMIKTEAGGSRKRRTLKKRSMNPMKGKSMKGKSMKGKSMKTMKRKTMKTMKRKANE